MFQNTTLSQQGSLFPALQLFFIFSCVEKQQGTRQRRTISKPHKNNQLAFSPTPLQAQIERRRIHHWMCSISVFIHRVIQDSHKPAKSFPKTLIVTFSPATPPCPGALMWIPRVHVSALGMLLWGRLRFELKEGQR